MPLPPELCLGQQQQQQQPEVPLAEAQVPAGMEEGDDW